MSRVTGGILAGFTVQSDNDPCSPEIHVQVGMRRLGTKMLLVRKMNDHKQYISAS